MYIKNQKLKRLREAMRDKGVDAYLILSSDPHLSEYLPKHWKGREWISGFSGSMGDIIVFLDEAFLWVDGRYWIQAEQELKESEIQIKKLGVDEGMLDFLQRKIYQGKLGVDGRTLSCALKQEIESRGIVVQSDMDLLSNIWENRPQLEHRAIFEFPLKYACISVETKLLKVREEMQKVGVDCHLISSLEDIAWICNLRGDDIAYNPVFLSYLWITKEGAILFLNLESLSVAIKEKLKDKGIECREYAEIFEILPKLKGKTLLLDQSKTTAKIFDSLPIGIEVLNLPNPSIFLKSIKTPQEINHIQEAMIADGVAMCELLAWLEGAQETISELDIAEKIIQIRSKDPLYYEESFACIAGFGKNGALPHYHASKDSYANLSEGLLLLDCGAHYFNGTTDITRVIPIGKITEEQKKDYTRVLKAHIAMSMTTFPKGIVMPMLDSITRAQLWQEGIDYHHGTGHGVGYFLNVHEGPQVLSCNSSSRARVFEGMVLSIEPGIYREGQWGVRLENLVVVQKAKTLEEGFGEFLKFESLTLCPFERECIKVEMLSTQEREWLNKYHQKVKEKLLEKLKKPMQEWLLKKTKEI